MSIKGKELSVEVHAIVSMSAFSKFLQLLEYVRDLWVTANYGSSAFCKSYFVMPL